MVQVDQRNESILVPIYGLMVPFHILAVKNAVNSQEGDHSYIRINFNFGPSYEPSAKFPNLIFLKELSYRTSDNRHAAKARSPMWLSNTDNGMRAEIPAGACRFEACRAWRPHIYLLRG